MGLQLDEVQAMKTRTYFSAVVLAVAGAVSVGPPLTAAAQGNATPQNVVPESELAVIQAKITAIDPNTRLLTLRGRSGHMVTLTAGPAVRLEMLKVGDTVNARYYRSVSFLVRPPSGGSGLPAPSDDQISQVVAQNAQAPGGIGVRLTKVSGTVVGVDMAAHSVDLVDPSGGEVYTIDVADPARIALLSALKVGDRITAVISQALAVSIEPARKSFF